MAEPIMTDNAHDGYLAYAFYDMVRTGDWTPTLTFEEWAGRRAKGYDEQALNEMSASYDWIRDAVAMHVGRNCVRLSVRPEEWINHPDSFDTSFRQERWDEALAAMNAPRQCGACSGTGQVHIGASIRDASGPCRSCNASGMVPQ